MEQYLIDNNAISSFFSGLFSQKGMDFMAEVIDQAPTISVITEIEALAWTNPDKSKEEIIKSFVADATILDINHAVVVQCVNIRRSRKLKTPDAIIAATAIVHNLTLITSDRDFENIPELKILNPQHI
ncbi:MAG: type II toxin-antitoxin system VapC family toxin [Cyclobacteriaceae bacterium]|nr:type II toxin-antitoxin system VapC family toxin [Cyclobacteriaceae bacterium]